MAFQANLLSLKNRISYPPSGADWGLQDLAMPAAAYASSTTRVLAGTGAYTLDTNYINERGAGITISGFLAGQYSTTGTPTLKFGFAFGTTAQTDLLLVTLTTGSGVTSINFQFTFSYTILTVGSSGTGIGQALLLTDDTTKTLFNTETTADTIDTTAANQIGISLKWGTNSASNTATVTQQLLNIG